MGSLSSVNDQMKGVCWYFVVIFVGGHSRSTKLPIKFATKRGRCLGVAEEPADEGKAETGSSAHAREAVSEVVEADVLKVGALADAVPRAGEVDQRALASAAW